MVNVSRSQHSLLEAKIIPGTPYSDNGVEIVAGISWNSNSGVSWNAPPSNSGSPWLEIKKHSYVRRRM